MQVLVNCYKLSHYVILWVLKAKWLAKQAQSTSISIYLFFCDFSLAFFLGFWLAFGLDSAWLLVFWILIRWFGREQKLGLYLKAVSHHYKETCLQPGNCCRTVHTVFGVNLPQDTEAANQTLGTRQSSFREGTAHQNPGHCKAIKIQKTVKQSKSRKNKTKQNPRQLTVDEIPVTANQSWERKPI